MTVLALVLVLAQSQIEGDSMAEELGHGQVASCGREFHFPKVNPNHRHMRLLLENAFRYVDPYHELIDPVSGYPVEGWNQEPLTGLFLRSFTQLTAVGQWIELLANIVAGYADNPYISRPAALKKLSLAVKSLREDQENPTLAAKGLLVNFMGLEGGKRAAPLLESIERTKFVETFGEQKGNAVWEALEEKGWIKPEGGGEKGRIKRGEKYGAERFDGALSPYADEPLRSEIMRLLDQRVIQVIFGDNANLTAALAKSIGALLQPEIRDDPEVSGLREEMERLIDVQKDGYRHLLDEKSGTFYFGWDATADRFVGWEDGQGNWVHGRMNYFINEFRGPWTFVVLRYGLQEDSIRNAGFKIKPYRFRNGRDRYALAAWEGSAFQLLGLSLFMKEPGNPGWARSLENLVDIELDYSDRKDLPGFLSEAYSGNGTEYTGLIGISDLAVTNRKLMAHAPSLYTLGVAYTVAPAKIEGFLEDHWRTISRLFTSHGPWEGYNTSANEVIRYQTTVHTLSLILGAIGSSHENMDRYLKLKDLHGRLGKLYEPGERVNLLSAENQVIPWTVDRSPIQFSREGGTCRFKSRASGIGGMTFVVPDDRGVSLSNGRLLLRYRSETPVEDSHISFKRDKDDPFPALSIPIEIFARFNHTKGQEREMEIVLPATPALTGIQEVSLVFGKAGKRTAVDISITGFEFAPFEFALAPGK
ncbi:MAG: hypothetical protein AB1512_05025 [Thermodesulfobacteriota bacterium]